MKLWKTKPYVQDAFKARPVETVLTGIAALAVIIGLVVFFGPDAKAVNDYDLFLAQINSSTTDDESAMDEQLNAKSCPVDDPCHPPPWDPDVQRRKYDRGELGSSTNMQVPLRIRQMMRDAWQRHFKACTFWWCASGTSTPPDNSCVVTYTGGCVKGDPATALHIPWSDVKSVAWTCAGSGVAGAVWAMRVVDTTPARTLKASYLFAAGAGFEDGVKVCAFATAYHHFFDWPF